MLGSHPSSTEKTHFRTIARKKTGIETPISDKNRLAWSTGLPWRLAAMNPSGMPISVAKSIAPSASSIVAGNRSLSSSVMGTPRGDARAEVAVAERPLEIPPVLLVDRLVEAVLLPDLRDRLVGRPLAQQRLCRRPGQRPDPDEDEQGKPDQDRDEQEEPADGEAEHELLPTSSSAGPRSRGDRSSYPTKRTVANDSSETGLGL
jgi:hypothetical protein